MKIVLAPDGFKESLSAIEVANCLERGIKRAIPDAEIVKVPMADGGDGTVEALVEATEGEILNQKVTGPLGEPVEACYGILGDGQTAVIEMAEASGLHLIPPRERNPLSTTTYGTGELIEAALEKGIRKLIVGIGGSATVDGGAGMAQALGAQLPDDNDKQISFGGGNLGRLARVDMGNMDPRLKFLSVLVASDVDNPLVGPEGAASVYGPQKGATPEMVRELDENLSHYADVIKRDSGIDVASLPGAGAAGGLGGGLVAFLKARLRPGVEVVIEASGLEEKLKDAHLVITGEGKIDSQTLHGKAPIGVAKVAKKQDLPVVAIAGSIGEDAQVVLENGIDAILAITSRPMSLAQALEKAPSLVTDLGEQIARLLKIGTSHLRRGSSA